MKKKKEPTWCCKECGGTNVEMRVWVDANTDKVFDSCSDGSDEDTWCRDCEDHTGIMLKTEWDLQNKEE